MCWGGDGKKGMRSTSEWTHNSCRWMDVLLRAKLSIRRLQWHRADKSSQSQFPSQDQYYQYSDLFFKMKFLFIVSFCLLLLPLAFACPFQVQRFCACVDQLDGVLLNCTAPMASSGKTPANGSAAAIEMMQVLKNSQAHLGLIKLLAIHDTPIPVLNNGFFNGLYIKHLELVNCQIGQVEKGAFRGQEGVMQELALNGNLIEQMPAEALEKMNSLVRLDLSSNAIGEIKAEQALPRLMKLTDINLSRNRITAVHKSFFENVKATLQTINLGHNLLEEVPASALRGFRMLMALHLHNNRLQSLPQLSFMNLPVLSLLNLASNQIQSVHRQAFLNVPQLRFLYLSANRITEVLPFQFSSFERLEMLDFTNNQLESLGNDSFAGLPSLRQLYLGENQIGHIQTNAFSQNSSIAVLILEQNRMVELAKDTFQNLRQLQQLSLKANKLRTVDAGAFQGNPALVMLDLSHNELIDLAPATFLTQLNLLLVDLSHNHIIRTPFGAFGRRVATVLLQENPLVCVERIHMLQQGNGVFIPNSDDAICVGMTQKEVPSATTLTAHQQQMAVTDNVPLLAEESIGQSGTDSANEHEEEQSAFVQQQVDNSNNNHQQSRKGQPQWTRLPNIKPIRIDPATEGSHQQRGTLKSAEDSTEPIPLSESIAAGEERTVEHGIPVNPMWSTIGAGDEESAEFTTTELTTVDPAEARFNPNVIYPHPVPFLKPAPKMHTATHIESDEQGNPILRATLPPSIVVADNAGIPPSSAGESQQNPIANENEQNLGDDEGLAETNNIDDASQSNQHQKNNSSTNYGKFEEFQLPPENSEIQRIEAHQTHSVDENVEESDAKRRVKSTLPTAVIVVCMGTVGVVMCAVFVGLCVARKRQLHQQLCSEAGISLTTTAASHGAHHYSEQHSPNSNSFMSAAAAARAAQMNGFFYPAQQQGTLQRGMQRSASGTLNRLAPMQDDIYGWLYTPSGYNAYKK